MTSSNDQTIDFGSTLSKLQNPQVWEYQSESNRTCGDVAAETFASLQSPLDFPPLDAAIVPGDRVAIAVDPNVPAVDQVVAGAIRALQQSTAGEIEIVVSDEATDTTLESIARIAGDGIEVSRHCCSKRECLRYLGADEEADPIYLNRWLVDADFVLPIAASRALDTHCDSDLTGLFPSFADSRSRRRCLARHVGAVRSNQAGSPTSEEPAWLLGIQVMISVTANHLGLASQILSGTPDAIRKQRAPARRLPDEFPPSAPLVIASLDGGAQQQSWVNAARAVSAAARYALPEATIVLWSAIADTPSIVATEALDDSEGDDALSAGSDQEADEEFPPWNSDEAALRTLARIAEEHRLLIRSQLDRDLVEGMGFAAIDSSQQLIKLSQSFDSGGILRAAQFAGTTIDSSFELA